MYDEADVREVDYRLDCVPQEIAARNGNESTGAWVPPRRMVRLERRQVQVTERKGEDS